MGIKIGLQWVYFTTVILLADLMSHFKQP
jgi:hypothetical protein